jgi:predicted protein tyrosine phosphatase
MPLLTSRTKKRAGDRSMRRVLFVCSRNRRRSPAAEQVFTKHPGVECASAGIRSDADNPVTSEIVEWVDRIFVMDRKQQQQKFSRKFRPHLRRKRVICLDIPDKVVSCTREFLQVMSCMLSPVRLILARRRGRD